VDFVRKNATGGGDSVSPCGHSLGGATDVATKHSITAVIAARDQSAFKSMSLMALAV
jgi:hypothetical protein